MAGNHLSYTSAFILLAMREGAVYGFDIMDVTGLPSGTVYPALRRMETNGLVRSRWEQGHDAVVEQRPARKYYRLTNLGHEALSTAALRYRLPEPVAREVRS